MRGRYEGLAVRAAHACVRPGQTIASPEPDYIPEIRLNSIPKMVEGPACPFALPISGKSPGAIGSTDVSADFRFEHPGDAREESRGIDAADFARIDPQAAARHHDRGGVIHQKRTDAHGVGRRRQPAEIGPAAELHDVVLRQSLEQKSPGRVESDLPQQFVDVAAGRAGRDRAGLDQRDFEGGRRRLTERDHVANKHQAAARPRQQDHFAVARESDARIPAVVKKPADDAHQALRGGETLPRAGFETREPLTHLAAPWS